MSVFSQVRNVSNNNWWFTFLTLYSRSSVVVFKQARVICLAEEAIPLFIPCVKRWSFLGFFFVIIKEKPIILRAKEETSMNNVALRFGRLYVGHRRYPYGKYLDEE